MPLKGKSDEEIKANRSEALNDILKKLGDEPFTVITGENKFFKNIKETFKEKNALRVFCLGDSIKLMSECDAVYFAKGWTEAKGCQIEHDVAVTYEIPILND